VGAAICCGRAPFHKAASNGYWKTRTSARGWRAPTALNPSTHGLFWWWVSLIWRRVHASTWRGKLAATVPNWPTTALLQLLTPRKTCDSIPTRVSISILDNVNDEIC
jgi:hypothetical protein